MRLKASMYAIVLAAASLVAMEICSIGLIMQKSLGKEAVYASQNLACRKAAETAIERLSITLRNYIVASGTSGVSTAFANGGAQSINNQTLTSTNPETAAVDNTPITINAYVSSSRGDYYNITATATYGDVSLTQTRWVQASSCGAYPSAGTLTSFTISGLGNNGDKDIANLGNKHFLIGDAQDSPTLSSNIYWYNGNTNVLTTLYAYATHQSLTGGYFSEVDSQGRVLILPQSGTGYDNYFQKLYLFSVSGGLTTLLSLTGSDSFQKVPVLNRTTNQWGFTIRKWPTSWPTFSTQFLLWHPSTGLTTMFTTTWNISAFNESKGDGGLMVDPSTNTWSIHQYYTDYPNGVIHFWSPSSGLTSYAALTNGKRSMGNTQGSPRFSMNGFFAFMSGTHNAPSGWGDEMPPCYAYVRNNNTRVIYSTPIDCVGIWDWRITANSTGTQWLFYPISTGSGTKFYVWSPATGSLTTLLSGLTANETQGQFSPSNAWLAIGSQPNSYIWNTSTGVLSTLAINSSYPSIPVWDNTTGTERVLLEGNNSLSLYWFTPSSNTLSTLFTSSSYTLSRIAPRGINLATQIGGHPYYCTIRTTQDADNAFLGGDFTSLYVTGTSNLAFFNRSTQALFTVPGTNFGSTWWSASTVRDNATNTALSAPYSNNTIYFYTLPTFPSSCQTSSRGY